MNEEQYTIRTLDELNEIDEGVFSELGKISFKLPNGEQVNPRAESQVLRILGRRAMKIYYRSRSLRIRDSIDLLFFHHFLLCFMQ